MQKALPGSSPPMTLLQGWPVCSWLREISSRLPWADHMVKCPALCDHFLWLLSHMTTQVWSRTTQIYYLRVLAARGPKLVSRSSNQDVDRTAFWRPLRCLAVASCVAMAAVTWRASASASPAWSRPLLGLWPSSSSDDPVDHPENYGQLLSEDPELHHTCTVPFAS